MNKQQSNTFTLFGENTPMSGRCLIEASAGTGKTYNLSGLFVRLVAENKFGSASDPSQIVVVTYTKAATRELQERITERLRRARDLLGSFIKRTSIDDNFLLDLQEYYAEDEEACRNLEEAVRCIDDLSVYTIHGYAHRLLMEFGPRANIDYTGEIVTDPREFTAELIYDFWRSLLMEAENDLTSRALLESIQEDTETPEQFIRTYAGMLSDTSISFDQYLSREELRNRIQRAGKKLPDLQEKLSSQVIGEFRGLFEKNEPENLPLYKNPFKPEKWTEYEDALEEVRSAENVVEAGWSNWKQLKYLGAESIRNKIKKNGSFDELPLSPTARSVMEYIEKIRELLAPFFDRRGDILQGILAGLQEAYFESLKERDEYSYDDLLYMANRMVQEHPDVRKAIRDKYPISLIDEFQDTDPLQWSMFDRVYDTSVADSTFLCLIGDPKQSIYRFRGADVQAYLKAKETVPSRNRFTLETNWRSDESMINALNTLWGRHEHAFYDEGIQYHEVRYPDHRDPIEKSLEDQPALQWVVDDATQTHLNKQQARERAAEITARHIQRTLQQPKRNEEGANEDQSVEPGDIAVLCGTNQEAAMMKRRLFERGMNSVQLSRDNVFDSREARELQLIMEAAAEPANASRIRAAMGTQMLGGSELLVQLARDPEVESDLQQKWEAWLLTVDHWHHRWMEDGLTAMLRQVLEQGRCMEHLLKYHDGERRVTNLRHLVDLMQEVARERPGEIQYQLHELRRRRKEAGERSVSEEEELRLESDRDLINIVTVHRSKGLEYPIVYTPFLWNGINVSNLWRHRPYVYHAPDATGGEQQLDIDGKQYAGSRYFYFREELEDQLRMAYVALTRAEHHNVIVHVPYQHNYSENGHKAYSAIDYVLFGPQRYQQALRKKFKDHVGADATEWITYPEVVGQIEELARSEQNIEMERWTGAETETDTGQGSKATQEEHLLELRSFTDMARLKQKWVIQSYSGLRRGVEDSSDPVLEAYNVQMDDPENQVPEELDPATDETSMFTFPMGARTGLCWHQIYEEIKFGDESTYEPVIRRQLESHGFDPGRWTPVLHDHVKTTLGKPLESAGGVRLGELEETQVNKEMEFHFGYDRADAAGILQIIRPDTEHLQSRRLPGGFMNGYIDLTFESDEKVYLLDYKSNHLGTGKDDYQPGVLKESIREHYYDLQYYLYTLALHRYLRQRIGENYEYNTHFGGVFYLYLRGISEGAGAEGVFYDRPSKETIEALDHHFKAENGYG